MRRWTILLAAAVLAALAAAPALGAGHDPLVPHACRAETQHHHVSSCLADDDAGTTRDVEVIVVKKDDDDDNVFTWRWPDDAGGAWLGVHLLDLNEQLGDYFGVEDGDGVLVTEVEEDSPAERAGLKAGDVITGLDDQTVTDSDDLVKAIRRHEEGDTVTVHFLRRGKKKHVRVKLGERPEPPAPAFGPDHPAFPFGSPERFFRRLHRLDAGEGKLRRELENLRADIEELRARLDELDKNRDH